MWSQFHPLHIAQERFSYLSRCLKEQSQLDLLSRDVEGSTWDDGKLLAPAGGGGVNCGLTSLVILQEVAV
jgi:hypothetical protein